MSRFVHAFTAMILLTSAGFTGTGTARASTDDPAINGVYTAVSDGQWAKTNESFQDEATVTSTWTITSACTTYQDRTGTVASDRLDRRVGLRGRAVARRTNHCELGPCPDGPAAPGEQSITFWPARANAPDRHTHLAGWDKTVGPSGA